MVSTSDLKAMVARAVNCPRRAYCPDQSQVDFPCSVFATDATNCFAISEFGVTSRSVSSSTERVTVADAFVAGMRNRKEASKLGVSPGQGKPRDLRNGQDGAWDCRNEVPGEGCSLAQATSVTSPVVHSASHVRGGAGSPNYGGHGAPWPPRGRRAPEPPSASATGEAINKLGQRCTVLSRASIRNF